MALYRSRLRVLVAMRSVAQDGKTWTHKEIAAQVGLTRQTVARWMSDDPLALIDVNALEGFSQWLGVPWHTLIERIDDPSQPVNLKKDRR